MNEEPLYIYDSLSQSKLKFKAVNPGYVGLYVCGPTVYNHVHLGNVRTFISFDVIYRYLQYLGYKVRYVRNITDAGHLENDADEGEDRISKKARLEQLEPMEVVQRYTVDFHHILKKFNCLPPNIEPTATGHIIEQIELINDILDKGFAYETNGSVYFDVIKFNNISKYGKLSNRDIEDLVHNTRKLEGQSQKKNPQDFALWKRAEPQHIMRWPSPWGEGFPGWHLECTAMSTKYLGVPFDIHGGGMDLKFPHHECEIAQAESLHGKSPVNYWVHTNMLTLNGQKMSKSTGNNVLPSQLFSGDHPLLSRSYSPEVLRFFMLQAHYRSILDFSNEAIIASEKGYLKLMDSLNQVKNIKPNTQSIWNLDKWKTQCFSALNDDFNTPILIAQLFEATKVISKLDLGILTLNHNDLNDFKNLFNDFIIDVLGLKPHAKQNHSEDINHNLMELILTLRNEARVNKDFKTSDLIRNQLNTMGIKINDTLKGTDYTIKK